MLAILHLDRFETRGELAGVDTAIKCLSQAVRLTPEGHHAQPGPLSNLGVSYLFRFQCLGELVDLNRAIACHIEAVHLTPKGDEDWPGRLSNLAIAYGNRFTRLGELSDLEKAIDCDNEAVKLTPPGHPRRPTLLNNLGSSYRDRFERCGKLADVDKAIECHSQAVSQISDDHTKKPTVLNNLGNSYLRRFERLGELIDINKAVECQSQAVQLTPEGHPSRPTRLNSLGGSHMRCFERFGEIIDIDKAIEYLSQAVRLTPEGHPDMAGHLGNLGVSCWNRYKRLGELVDLDKAIECNQQAVQLAPDGQEYKLTLLSDLGALHLQRFDHFGRPADLDRAIEYGSQAVRLTPEGHTDRPDRLNGLGSAYRERFNRHGNPMDLDQAITYHSQAVRLTSMGHVIQPGQLNNLGRSYLSRFERYGQLADVDKAIECHNQAMQLTPAHHADQATWLGNLGASYLYRFEHHRKSSDLENATAFFKQAAQLIVGDPRPRFAAAHSWAQCASFLGISSMPAYQRIMELVPQLVWLGTTINRRYELLKKLGDVCIEAASCAISLRVYDRALEWLEEGRSVVWNQLLQLRTPFDSLHAANPTLANRLKTVALHLERVGSGSATSSLSTNDASDMEKNAQQHRLLATEWEQLLGRARQTPGFTDFLRPRKADALIRGVKDRTVIFINVHSSRCDALIILPNSTNIAHIHLSSWSPQKARDTRVKLMSVMGHRNGRAGGFKRTHSQKSDELFKQVLATLWSDVVKPIVDFLGYTPRSSIQELPHVTWCATGPLSFLPIHAAGCYDGSQPNASDLFVSSYTPTLSALIARSPMPRTDLGILAVGQEHTKSFSSLPNTVRELAAIKEHVKGIRYLQLDGKHATGNAVVEAMGKYSWVHLACHATQDRQDPSQSAFHLYGGELTLSTIAQSSFEHKGLAFLSACQTAAGDESLPDEAVHLAAGIQMAGYPSVIATMWSINDEDAPEVARDVYADLLRDERMDCTMAPVALHKAITGLRKKIGESSFERWVPFIHMGV